MIRVQLAFEALRLADVRKMNDLEAGHYIMSEFLGIVLRDKVDLQTAHRKFLKVDEYLPMSRALTSDRPKTKTRRAA